MGRRVRGGGGAAVVSTVVGEGAGVTVATSVVRRCERDLDPFFFGGLCDFDFEPLPRPGERPGDPPEGAAGESVGEGGTATAVVAGAGVR